MVAHVFSETLPNPMRSFGRFELRRLLGKSAATMVWLALDRDAGAERMLTLPRAALSNPAALAHWIDRARHAARVVHSNLVPVVEVGVHEQFPYIAVDRSAGITLPEWLTQHAKPNPTLGAGWVAQILRGLAVAHAAGASHGDPQLHHLVIDPSGAVSVMALGCAEPVSAGPAIALDNRGMAMDPAQLQAQREAAERDVLACGVLLHHLLAGEAPFGIADTTRAIERIAPLGTATLRLMRTASVPEALCAIVNRATSVQPRLRYRSARTLEGALSGWLESQARDSAGPLALLLDRVHSVGHLPAFPGLAARVARVIALENQRTDEIASQILPDLGLSFELLRTLNSATVQGTQIAGDGPVLTVRRAVELVGVHGVRAAAQTLQAWPGALGAEAAERLKTVMDGVRLAGHVAQGLRPAGYDPEVVFLIAALQNLGRLMVCYHFAEEAEQIEQLMRPPAQAAADATGSTEALALTEEVAAYTVLGIEIAAFGASVGRLWGLGDEVQQLIRRLPRDAAVRKPDSDLEMLRIVASAANEAIDVVTLQAPRRVAAGLERIAERYGRVLRINLSTLRDALEDGRDALRRSAVAAPPSRVSSEPTTPMALAD